MNKCFRYWPTKMYNPNQDVGQLLYGDIAVYVLGGRRENEYIVSELLLRHVTKARPRVCFFFYRC